VEVETSNLVDMLIVTRSSSQVENHHWKGRGPVTRTI